MSEANEVFAALDQTTILTIVALLYPPLIAIGGALMKMNRKINESYKYVDPASSTTNENDGKTLPARVSALEKARVQCDHRISLLEVNR